MEDKERLRIVVNRLIEENRYSLEEYDGWTDLARKWGLTGVAERLEEAKKAISSGNDALASALEMMQ
jgi:hypothetical protein